METVAKKTKRSVLKREKRDARKEAAKTGPSVAQVEKRSNISSQDETGC